MREWRGERGGERERDNLLIFNRKRHSHEETLV
jgi:hypothetical protein